MTSAAVAVTIDSFTSRDDAVQFNRGRLGYRRTADGHWQQVREETATLKDVNIVTQLNRVHEAYRLLQRLAPSDTQLNATFPLYLEVPTQASSSSEGIEMCLPEIGAFPLVQQLQCQTEERQQTSDSTSTGQAAAMFGGTLVAAFLMYSLLPYVRARQRKRRCSRSRTTNKDRLSWWSGQIGLPTTSTTAAEASRRIWGSLDGGSIEPAEAYCDGLRKRKSRQHEVVDGNDVPDAVSELLMAKLPDFNDERGWRDFFDMQIYHSESQVEQRAVTKIVPNIKSRRDAIAARSSKLRQMKSYSTARGQRYRTIRDRIDRAAMEAAINDAQSFNEFWQM
ncbi:hypothetical protein DD237_003106 [Peronospora effusa]|uniref:Uncharacterized protein n=1 Tax=Peronospora effusa TaxID=542832 RepID=A0A3R7WBV1_9STRA|nr:hypothetical protein DD237_003106 [Peronospora effusa]